MSLLLFCAITIVFCTIIIETFTRFEVLDQVLKVGNLAKQSSHVMTSKAISDHWKERAIRKYSGLMFAASGKLLIFVLFIALLVWCFDQVIFGFSGFLFTWIGIIFATIYSFAYLKLRSRLLG